MANIFQDHLTNVSLKYMSYMGRGIPHGYDNKISRHFASFIVDSAQLKFKNHRFLRLQISVLCQKSVQIRSFFCSVFSHIPTEYGEIRSISPYAVRMRENTDQIKLRIWTLFTQCLCQKKESMIYIHKSLTFLVLKIGLATIHCTKIEVFRSGFFQ